MKKLYSAIFILLTFIFTGCTAMRAYPTPDAYGSYYKKSYTLDQTYTITVGETLFSIYGVHNGVATVYPKFISPEDIEIKSTLLQTINTFGREQNFSIKKSEILNVVAQTTYNGESYYLINANPAKRFEKNTSNDHFILVNTKTFKIYPKIFWNFPGKTMTLEGGYSFSKDISLIELEPDYVIKNPKDQINFNIVYNGISGDTLRFTYREFTGDDLARPAFFQDLTYNKNDKLIKFRGIEIEILKVTSNELTYKIIHDGLKTNINKK